MKKTKIKLQLTDDQLWELVLIALKAEYKQLKGTKDPTLKEVAEACQVIYSYATTSTIK